MGVKVSGEMKLSYLWRLRRLKFSSWDITWTWTWTSNWPLFHRTHMTDQFHDFQLICSRGIYCMIGFRVGNCYTMDYHTSEWKIKVYIDYSRKHPSNSSYICGNLWQTHLKQFINDDRTLLRWWLMSLTKKTIFHSWFCMRFDINR